MREGSVSSSRVLHVFALTCNDRFGPLVRR